MMDEDKSSSDDYFAPQATNLRPSLLAFVDQGILSEELYIAARKAAAGALRSVGREVPAGELDDAIGDLATDFLVNRVKAGQLVDLETVAGLKGEMIRFLTGRDAPESRELWLMLSEAMRELARQGRVVRLDGTLEERNSNVADWMLADCSARRPFDVEGFRERASGVGTYHPLREEGRIISPGAARELIRGLLEAAQSRVPFGELVEEAKRHVVFGMRHRDPVEHESEDGEVFSTEAIAYRYDVDLWLEEEAAMRSEVVWQGSGKVDGEEGHSVLCRYFLPKHFLGQEVTLASIGGNFRRQSERGRVIREIFARSLALTPTTEERSGAEEGLFLEALASLTGRVASILMQKCSEKYADLNFTLIEPGHERGENL